MKFTVYFNLGMPTTSFIQTKIRIFPEMRNRHLLLLVLWALFQAIVGDAAEKECVLRLTPEKYCTSRAASTTALQSWLLASGIGLQGLQTESNLVTLVDNGWPTFTVKTDGSFAGFGDVLKVPGLQILDIGSKFTFNMETIMHRSFYIVGYESGKCIHLPPFENQKEDFETNLSDCQLEEWNERFVALRAGGGSVYLIFAFTGLCLEPKEGSSEEGVPLAQRSCVLGNQNQMWIAQQVTTDATYIMNVQTGLVIEVLKHSKENGGGLILSSRQYVDYLNQLWSPWGPHEKVMGRDGGIDVGYDQLELDIDGWRVPSTVVGTLGTGGTRVVYYILPPNSLGRDGSDFQVKLNGRGSGIVMFVGVASGRCWNFKDKPNQMGFPINMSPCVCSSPSFRFELLHGVDDWFYIIGNSGLCLGSDGNSAEQGTKVVQDTCKVNNHQQLWRFEEESFGSGQFYIRHMETTMVMEAEEQDAQKDQLFPVVLSPGRGGNGVGLSQLWIPTFCPQL